MAEREKLPDTRESRTVTFRLLSEKQEPVKCYVTVGLYEDGTPGELFITLGKEGETAHGFAQSWATSMSLMFQYGVPYEHIYAKFKGNSFEPSGFTGRPERMFCKSLVDAVISYLEANFPPTGGPDRDDYDKMIGV